MDTVVAVITNRWSWIVRRDGSVRDINKLERQPRDRPEIWGIMTIGIGPAGYVAGWGFADGMDAAFGRDGD